MRCLIRCVPAPVPSATVHSMTCIATALCGASLANRATCEISSQVVNLLNLLNFRDSEMLSMLSKLRGGTKGLDASGVRIKTVAIRFISTSRCTQ